MDEAVAGFLGQVAATGSSGGYEQLLARGEAFVAALLRLACQPGFPHALLAATLLKHAVDACRAALGPETRSRLIGCPQAQQEGPLGEQLRAAAARVAWHQWPHAWPACLRESPPRLRPGLLRALRRKTTQAAALEVEAQWCAEQGGPPQLLRQAARCGACLPLARFAESNCWPRVELLRLVRCSRDAHWAALRPPVAAAAAAAAAERPALCCELLERCGEAAGALAATTALRLLASEEEEDEEEAGTSEGLEAAGRLWETAFTRNPRDCVSLLLSKPGPGRRAMARALLRTDTETLLQMRLLSPWAALEALLFSSNTTPDAPTLRLLGRWAAEVPGPAERSRCVALCRRLASPASLEALAAVVCDARFDGPREHAAFVAGVLSAAARSGSGPGRLLPLLRALWLLLDAGGERGGASLEPLLPPLWPACRGHPLMEALLLRCVAAGCPAAPGVPELLRAALGSARGYLLDDILHLWEERQRRLPTERTLLPLLPPLLSEPAAWELLASYARAGAVQGPVTLPSLSKGQAADTALVLRRFALLEALLRGGVGLAVPPAELLALAEPSAHPAVRCRAAALACRAGLPVLPVLQELLPQLEEWLPPDALRPCLRALAAASPPLSSLAVLAPLCVLADDRLLGRDLLRRAAATHGPEAVAAAVADPTVFGVLWNAV